MSKTFASIHRCVKYLIGRTKPLTPDRKHPEISSRYSINGIKQSLAQICGDTNSNTITDTDLWEKYFLADKLLNQRITQRKIESLDMLLYKVEEYYTEYELW